MDFFADPFHGARDIAPSLLADRSWLAFQAGVGDPRWPLLSLLRRARPRR
jgi:hypothetical protein